MAQAFQPVLDVPITIRDPERPIGTHIFTAMDRTGDNGGIEWTVVSLQHGGAEHAVADPRRRAVGRRQQNVQLASTDQNSPEAALDRIVIPPETAERIAAMISPRSSVIISDEGLSSETGRRTDFVVLLSGEPQGGIATRRRSYGGCGSLRRSLGLALPVAILFHVVKASAATGFGRSDSLIRALVVARRSTAISMDVADASSSSKPARESVAPCAPCSPGTRRRSAPSSFALPAES